MNDLLAHPWMRVLLIATTIAMCSLALRETASITLPVVTALRAVLVPVAIGFTIAYVLTPLVDAVQRRGLNRLFAASVLFASFCLVVVVGFSLVVPTVVRQGATLATRLFEGEKYTDLNGNGRWDEGEPYEDANGNGRYDSQGMLSQALSWLQEGQGRLRQIAKLELDQHALSFLNFLQAETAASRDLIGLALVVARDGRSSDQWPRELSHNPSPEAPLAWNPSWPGATRVEIDEAFAKLPTELRERWIRNLAQAGQTYANQRVELLSALLAVRHRQAQQGPPTPLQQRVSAALQKPLSDAQAKDSARAFAAILSAEEKDGRDSARELLAELRGDEAGSQWLAPMVQSLENAVHSTMEALPARLGGWVKSGLSNIDSLFAVGLDALLVPIYAFFLILAMPAIRRGVKRYMPSWHRDQLLRIVRDIEKVVAAFFRGRLIVCLLCGFLTYLGFIVIGMFGPGVPYAALFALFIGLATAVPLAGILVLVPAILLTLMDGGTPTTAFLVLGVYICVQLIEMLALTPGIMGHEVELHPVTLLVALLLCGKLLGVLGLILAVPIAASCRILAREFLWPRLDAWANPTEHPERAASPLPGPS